MKKISGSLGCAIISIYGVHMYNATINDYNNRFNSIVELFCLFLFFVLFYKMDIKKNISSLKVMTISSIFLSLLFVFGVNVETYQSALVKSFQTYVLIICIAPLFFVFLYYCLTYLPIFLKKMEQCHLEGIIRKYMIKPNWIYFFVLWFCIAMAWLPVLLAFYPGLLTYDGMYQEVSYILGEHSNRHSVLMTFIMANLIDIGHKVGGNYNFGIFVYSLVQLLCLSASFAYLGKYLASRVNAIYAMAVNLFIMFFPANPFLAICSTKDTLFTICYVFIVIGYCEMFFNPDVFFKSYKKSIIMGILLFVSFCFKHNGFHATLLTIPFIFLYLRKYWKKILVIHVICIFAHLLYTGPFLTHLNVEHTAQKTAMCVPFQQIARTYNLMEEDLMEDDKRTLLNIWDEGELLSYNPYLSDPIVSKISEQEFIDNKDVIMRLWFKWCFEYLDIYIDSFLLNNYEFWYCDTVYPKENWHPGYFSFGSGNLEENLPKSELEKYPQHYYYTGTDSKLLWLNNTYANLCQYYTYQDIPFLNLLFNNGFYFLVIIFMLLLAFYFKIKEVNMALVPICTLLFTMFCGPASLVRYMYPVMIAIIPILGILLKKIHDIRMETLE